MPRRSWEIVEQPGNKPVGKDKNQLDVFFDSKTGLYFVLDDKSPKNKRYIKKSKIVFWTSREGYK